MDAPTQRTSRVKHVIVLDLVLALVGGTLAITWSQRLQSQADSLTHAIDAWQAADSDVADLRSNIDEDPRNPVEIEKNIKQRLTMIQELSQACNEFYGFGLSVRDRGMDNTSLKHRIASMEVQLRARQTPETTKTLDNQATALLQIVESSGRALSDQASDVRWRLEVRQTRVVWLGWMLAILVIVLGTSSRKRIQR